MGMDVVGINPKNAAGEYFRASVWSWRPICEIIENAICEPIPKAWHFNDGAGLDNDKSCQALALLLEHYLDENDFTTYDFEDSLRVDGTGKFVKTGGTPAYSVNREHLLEFIEFLKNCGGFQIF